MRSANRGWPRSVQTCRKPTSRGADRPPTAASRTSGFMAPRWSSSTPRRGVWTTSTRSIATRPMTTARSSRVASDTAIAIALMTAAAVATTLSAHRLDEDLQAARLAVEPSEVQLELDLTPGIAVAETVLADIDRNGDGLLSAEEQRAYAATVLSAIDLEFDRQPLRLQLVALTFPVSGAIK